MKIAKKVQWVEIMSAIPTEKQEDAGFQTFRRLLLQWTLAKREHCISAQDVSELITKKVLFNFQIVKKSGWENLSQPLFLS